MKRASSLSVLSSQNLEKHESGGGSYLMSLRSRTASTEQLHVKETS
jgi:hypothetical protein